MMVTHALGWALVDSLSQEALAGARLAALLALLPVRAARIRYALATLTLGLMLALPLASAVRLSGTSPWTDDVVTATSPVTPGPTSGPGPQAAPAAPPAAAPVAARIRAALEPALPWVVLVWFGGVVVLSLRLASGWLVTRQLGRVGTASVPDSCREAVARLAARLRISRPVRVLQSAVVQVPAVMGWLRPVILLPASALTGLTPLQLDALLAHELAHVRRYDYLVNLVQSVIETLLFYHPAVWWVSQQVREEREHCCDDLAVAVCGDAHFYATALVGMERLRGTPPSFARAAAAWALCSRSPAPTRTRASAARPSRWSVKWRPPRQRSASWNGSRSATPTSRFSRRPWRRSGTWAARRPSHRWRASPAPSRTRKYETKRWSSTPGAPPQSPRSSCWWTDSRTTARLTFKWRPSSAWRTCPTGSGSRRCGRQPAPTRVATCGPKRDAAWKTTARASRGRSRGQSHRSVRPEKVERIDGDRPIGSEPVQV